MSLDMPDAMHKPLQIIGESDEIFLLVSQGSPHDPMVDAVIYYKARGMFDPEIKPVAVWLKFLYFLQEVDPPIPFDEGEGATDGESA